MYNRNNNNWRDLARLAGLGDGYNTLVQSPTVFPEAAAERPIQRKKKMRSAVLLVLGIAHARSGCTNKEWAQCGGKSWSGETCCPDFDKCAKVNDCKRAAHLFA